MVKSLDPKKVFESYFKARLEIAPDIVYQRVNIEHAFYAAWVTLGTAVTTELARQTNTIKATSRGTFDS